MSYVDKNLAQGEELLLRARYHWVRFVPGASVALLGAVLAAANGLLVPAGTGGSEPGLGSVPFFAGGFLVLAGVLVMAWRALVDSFDEFAITTFRVIRKSGFVTRTVRQIPLEKVQDVNVKSTLGGRWLSYGDVELQTAGSDSTVIFPRILHPEEFRNVLFTHTRPNAAGTDGLGGRPAAALPVRASVEERLKEAERLYKTGVLSEAEYQEKRQALIREV
ncbi:MAG TPA: PH domain-containing protein [Thermoanaerobaculia bacterium]|nr:PH domain-containing protein [Thermoanaerobaculia bacterium]